MNSIQLTSILRGAIDKKVNFVGVFPKDKIPQTIRKLPACLVVNTDPSYKPGQHWVALYYDRQGKKEYFDSYGDEPRLYGFKLTNVKVVNKTVLQSLTSTTCGHFCVYYLVHRCHLSPPSILKKFCPTKPTCNDGKVMDFVHCLTSTPISHLQYNQCCAAQSCVRNCLCSH